MSLTMPRAEFVRIVADASEAFGDEDMTTVRKLGRYAGTAEAFAYGMNACGLDGKECLCPLRAIGYSNSQIDSASRDSPLCDFVERFDEAIVHWLDLHENDDEGYVPDSGVVRIVS